MSVIMFKEPVMRLHPLLVVILAAACLVSCKHAQRVVPAGWLSSFDAAVQKAARDKTLAMVDFYADW